MLPGSDRFAGIPYDSIPNRATRDAFRRLTGALGNMFLTGPAADRPTSARMGAYYLNQDGENEIYVWAGEGIGWLQIYNENGGGVPSVLHETLSDLQNAGGGAHSHLSAAQSTAVTTHQPFSATRVLFADADGHINHDAGFTYDAATDAFTAGGGIFVDANNDVTAPFASRAAIIRLRNSNAVDNEWVGLQVEGQGNVLAGGLAFVVTNYASRYGKLVLGLRSATGWLGTVWSVTRDAFTVGVPVQGVAGTAAAPSFSFSGDPDSGWYSSAADAVALSLGNAVRLTGSVSGGHCLLTLS